MDTRHTNIFSVGEMFTQKKLIYLKEKEEIEFRFSQQTVRSVEKNRWMTGSICIIRIDETIYS